MKKVLAFVLALAMVLGCFSTVFAKEFTDVAADADYATAVDVLSDLGVVSGYGDDYKPGNVVTRAEMASLLVKALGLTPSAATTTKFTDVKSTDWFAGWVAYANSLGIIAGRTETIFDPQATVSYDEAIVMIINALGYSGSLTGTYPTAYIMKAQELKITKGVDLLGSVGANRGDIAQLLYNTLGQEIGKTNKDGDWVSSGKTMYDRLGATVATAAVMVTPKMVEDASIDLEEYLGALIVPVYDEDDAVIAIKSVKTEWLTGKYKSSKIGTTAVLSGAFTTASAIFVNGAKVGTDAPADADTVAYKYAVVTNDDGEVKQVVSAQKWVGADHQVTAADIKDYKAGKTTLYGAAFSTTKAGKIDTEKFTIVGATSLDDIKEDDIVTGYLAGGKVVKLEVCDKVVTGKITKTGKGTVTVDGTTYDIASAVFSGIADTTEEVEFYFNYAGDIVIAKNPDSVAGEDYAVVLAASYAESADGWSDSDSEYTRQVKLLLATGEEVVYDVYGSSSTHPTTTELEFANKTAASNWATGMAGKVVTYALKNGKLDEVAEVTTGKISATAEKITAKASLDGKYFASSAVAFVWDATEKEYTVVTADKLAGMALTVPGAYYVVDNGTIAVLYTGAAVEDADAVYGIYTGEYSYIVADKNYTVSFMVDGKTVEYTTEVDPSVAFEAGAFEKIVFTGEDIAYTTPGAVEAVVTTGGAVSGNTYTYGVSSSIALDAEALVYVWDTTDEELTVGSFNDLEDEDNTYIRMYDTTSTPDKLYDVVVIYR